jgi:hypothetical protein
MPEEHEALTPTLAIRPPISAIAARRETWFEVMDGP